jgi:ABC-type transport system involved in cytochrome bd biosynthesis fused ATPase/permease subunit
MGLLKNKTRILCTHHTKYLSNADVVMEIKDGCIAQIGRLLFTSTKFCGDLVQRTSHQASYSIKQAGNLQYQV